MKRRIQSTLKVGLLSLSMSFVMIALLMPPAVQAVPEGCQTETFYNKEGKKCMACVAGGVGQGCVCGGIICYA